MSRRTKGVTLLELTIAIAAWMILSLSVFLLWQHTSGTTVNMLTRQNAFENARASMDALTMNIQMANAITLETTGDNVLERLTLTERDPQGQLHNYVFDFNVNALPGTARYQVLRFGANEFASNIARIYVTYAPSGRRMDISVKTGCDEPIVLHGSVDVRYKNITIRK